MLRTNNEVKLKKPKIDLERVRAKADRSIDLGVTTEYTVIPIRNPKPDEFFRCMPDEDYSMDASHIEPEDRKRVVFDRS